MHFTGRSRLIVESAAYLAAHCVYIPKGMSKKIKSSLHLRYYAEACMKRRGPSTRFSAWATQLRRNMTPAASRWRH